MTLQRGDDFQDICLSIFCIIDLRKKIVPNQERISIIDHLYFLS